MEWSDQSEVASGSSSDEEDRLPFFDTVAAGYEPLPDELRSPDSVTEASLADLCHSSGSSSGGQEEVAAGEREEAAAGSGQLLGATSPPFSPQRQQRWHREQGAGQQGRPALLLSQLPDAGSDDVLPAMQADGGPAGENAEPSSGSGDTAQVCSIRQPDGAAGQESTLPKQPKQAAVPALELANGMREGQASVQGGGDEGSSSESLGGDQRAAILAAMQGFQLGYRPAWADIVPEESWMRRLREGGAE